MAQIEPVELFISDPHGEYEEFSHIIRSACGWIREAIGGLSLPELGEDEKDELATLVYYPQEKMAALLESGAGAEKLRDIRSALAQLADCYGISSSEADASGNDPSDSIIALAQAIQRAAVSRVHVVGDIFDRGPAPDLILDELCGLDNLDIQWGNHDILWMGAALGQAPCVATAIRICARYGNLSILEENYGIDLSALRSFAKEVYGDDPCEVFQVKHNPALTDEDRWYHARVQKAIAIIQFKVEAHCIAQNPSFGLEHRNLLGKINYEDGTVCAYGRKLPMLDLSFPTVNPQDPYALTAQEQQLIDSLIRSFTGNERLQRHTRLFLERGSLYAQAGDILLFHACMPLNADGTLLQAELFGRKLAGKELFDAVDGYVRDAYLQTDPQARKRGMDMLWFLWLGSSSPLFAKDKMATFELYFVSDKDARRESKNAFYALIDKAETAKTTLGAFGMDTESSRIICGHVPVKVKDGESPVKCEGRLAIIDGGMSIPYQASSGVAGFTAVRDSRGLRIATHQRFCGREEAILRNAALHSDWQDWPI